MSCKSCSGTPTIRVQRPNKQSGIQPQRTPVPLQAQRKLLPKTIRTKPANNLDKHRG